MSFSGQCLCGKITFTSAGPVLWSGICHCESCRRATASPCAAFFGVPRASVIWDGAPAIHTSSQGKVQRLFCGDCGTQLSYQADKWPGESHLYMATLRDPDAVPPTAHFHWAEKLAWLEITDGSEKHEGSADADPPHA